MFLSGGTGFLHFTPDGKFVTVASGRQPGGVLQIIFGSYFASRGDPEKDLLVLPAQLKLRLVPRLFATGALNLATHAILPGRCLRRWPAAEGTGQTALGLQDFDI